MKKLISWNVNGLRACVGKGFMDFFNEVDADVFCIQESKLQEGQIDLDLPAIDSTGTMLRKRLIPAQPVSQRRASLCFLWPCIEEHDHEGRVITAESQSIHCYLLYSKLQRWSCQTGLPYDLEDAFLAYLKNWKMKSR